MLILNQSVTRQFWEPEYRTIVRNHQRGWARRVQSTQVYQVLHRAKSILFYVIFCETPHGTRPVGWLMLWQRPGWVAWEVIQLWVFPHMRGRGIARKLYEAAINGDDLLVASGTTHTKQSRALWESFIKKDLFSIWAQDFSRLTRVADAVWDSSNEEVFCSLRLYSRPKEKDKLSKNVRLIAMKKS